MNRCEVKLIGEFLKSDSEARQKKKPKLAVWAAVSNGEIASVMRMIDHMNYSTYDPKISNYTPKRDAGAIQAQIDLRLLAKFHIGQPLFSTDSADTHINVLNPDGLELHVSNSHYRDPVTGDRGDAIKFIQKIRRCSYGDAIAYLEGWLDLITFATRNLDTKTTDLPMQLSLFKFIAESSKS